MTEAAPRALQVVATAHALPYQVLPLCTDLIDAGWQVSVACGPGPEVERARSMGVDVLPVSMSRSLFALTHPASVRALVAAIRAGRYDVVHVHGPLAGILGRVAARITGTPALYHCRGTFHGDRGTPTERVAARVSPIFERILAPATTWAFTLNEEDRAYLIDAGGLPPERVICQGVGSFGVDLSVWDREQYPQQRRDEMRTDAGIPIDALVIGFSGRVVAAKGVLDLFEAFMRLRRVPRDSAAPLRLLIVGGTLPSERDQDTARRLRERIAAEGVDADVVFTGHVDEPAPWLSIMDVLALPSYREGFGQVLVEAGALGVPVVAADSRGTRQAVIQGETGLLVPPGDVDALAAALGTLLADAELRRRMGQRAAERVRSSLGREAVVGRILDCYADVLATSAGRG